MKRLSKKKSVFGKDYLAENKKQKTKKRGIGLDTSFFLATNKFYTSVEAITLSIRPYSTDSCADK